MKYTANLIGATGLVGSRLLHLLLQDERFDKLNVFTRRTTGLTHPKLNEYIIDFDKPEEWKDMLKGDFLFSTLGTTLKAAGSKEKQYKIDFSYQYSFAEIAAANGIASYVLVSSAGANAKSSVFYSRMKGELDEAVSKLNFSKITILRPSVLDGNRVEKRMAEQISIKIGKFVTKFILKKYRPIKDEIVARAMINASLQQQEKFKIVELNEIFTLAGL